MILSLCVWCGVCGVCAVWCGVVCVWWMCGVCVVDVRMGVVLCVVVDVQCGVVWCGVVWCVLWCGVVRCGVVHLQQCAVCRVPCAVCWAMPMLALSSAPSVCNPAFPVSCSHAGLQVAGLSLSACTHP